MIKLFEGFAGYGGASFGLQKVGIEFDCVGYSEIDKGAIKCYEQNHKGKNYGDISKINPEDLPDFDLFTGGFPCQDVSIAGNRDLSKGRTNLYLEILRIVKVKKPKFLVLENVKGLLSMEIDEGKLIHKIVRDLQKIGYGVAWKVLNSKDYGIPQNRERVWFVCKLGSWDFMEFQFPEKEKLKIFLKDILEKDVDEKYLLSEKQIKKIKERLNLLRKKGLGFGEMPIDDVGICSTLTSRDYKDGGKRIKINRIQFDVSGKGYNSQQDRIYDTNGIMASLPYNSPKNKMNIFINCLTEAQSRQGSSKEFLNTQKFIDTYNNKIKDISPTLTEPHHNSLRLYDKGIFRRLTPKECFRLMGFLNDEINLEGLSDTAKYKLAGNGWDVNLVSKIFKKLKPIFEKRLFRGNQTLVPEEFKIIR